MTTSTPMVASLATVALLLRTLWCCGFRPVATSLTALALLAGAPLAIAQGSGPDDSQGQFRQLDELLPTANAYRTAGGEPGHAYWQQQVDYDIEVTLDEDNQRLTGSQAIRYRNNSPDTLRYLWLHLDQNIFREDSIAERSRTFHGGGAGNSPARVSLGQLRALQYMEGSGHGYRIHRVADDRGAPLAFTVVGTLMRVDLPEPLATDAALRFHIDYSYDIVDGNVLFTRGGYEHFPADEREGGNYIFAISQWFPRLVAYTDYEGWTNKEFLGAGEFTLEFGDYDVAITVPADHIVAATGELRNPAQVLTRTQRNRLAEAATAPRPVPIVTLAEAEENERDGTDEMATWRFAAENVRDFAWASSRKFAWDAQGHRQAGAEQELVMAMSFYPKEGGTLWADYSTRAIIHTLEVYSRFSFDYPYPTAQSVSVDFVGGMEYPMISFNGSRATLQDDGSRTYSLAEKRFLIGVVIHEVGHFYFPMVVNSDERQWAWMDEGINSFLESIATREWDPAIPWGVEPRDITDYMASGKQVPMMSQPDSVPRLGPNAYGKPTAALNILRETVMGRELFDFAFKEYARRWRFKRPTPADFFRTMEDASGIDLDWFWRGWFYTTDHVDISLDRVYALRLDTENPDIDFARLREDRAALPPSVMVEANRAAGMAPWVERNPDVRDFYDDNDEFTVTQVERDRHQDFRAGLETWEREVLDRAADPDRHYHVLEFSNVGGLVMPIILRLDYADGSSERLTLPAEIWRRSPRQVSKLIIAGQPLVGVVVDPLQETADVDMENNYYPRRIIPARLESFTDPGGSGLADRDLMQDSKATPPTAGGADADASADGDRGDGEPGDNDP